MRRSLEIPLGRRTKRYRFWEILPGAVSYIGVILLFVLSYFSPIAGAVYLITIISMTLVKAVGIAYRTWSGFNTMKAAERVDWRKRCEDLERPHEAYERLRGRSLEGYDYNVHVANLKRISSDAEAKEKYLKPSEVYQAVIMAAYNEGIDTMRPDRKSVV